MSDYQTNEMLVGRINAQKQLIKQAGNEIKQLERVLSVRLMNVHLETTREEDVAMRIGAEKRNQELRDELTAANERIKELMQNSESQTQTADALLKRCRQLEEQNARLLGKIESAESLITQACCLSDLKMGRSLRENHAKRFKDMLAEHERKNGQAIEAAQADALESVRKRFVPDGCVVVPITPTKEMINAGLEFAHDAQSQASAEIEVRTVYASMTKSARNAGVELPEPPKQQNED